MPKTLLNASIWSISMTLATGLLAAALTTSFFPISGPIIYIAFDQTMTLMLCSFSAIFSFICLSFSLNQAIGRPLTLYSSAACLLFLALALVLIGFDFSISTVQPLLFAGALLLLLRAIGVTVLPPIGDHCGVREATIATVLAASVAAIAAIFFSLTAAIGIGAATLLFSWPSLLDGINAFADKVFYQAARAQGARDLAPRTFSRIQSAQDIVIDKAAVMSGPDLIVTNVMAFDNDPKTLLAVAASAEAHSCNPVALALRQLAAQWHVTLRAPEKIEPAPGIGVVALLGGQTVVIGTTDLLKQLKIDSFTADAIARSLEADGKTVLRVAVGGRVVGVLGLEGTLRQDAGVAGMAFRKEGLVPWLYSADSQKTREALAGMLGLEVFEDPQPDETVYLAASKAFSDKAPLVLTLSQDRCSLELRETDDPASFALGSAPEPIAASDTADIGAFPALMSLANQRNKMALKARRVLSGLWLFAGLTAAVGLLPIIAAPLVFCACLLVLWCFARLSIEEAEKLWN